MSMNNKNNDSIFLENFQKKLFEFFKRSINSGPTFLEKPIKIKTNLQSGLDPLQTKNSQNLEPATNTSQNTNASRINSSPRTRTGSKTLTNRFSRFPENTKQQVVSITYEEIGLFPRSFNRVFDRFFKQLFFDVENLVIQEYRFYRYLFLTTVKCMFILLFVPLTINFLAKNYLVRPITEYYWNRHQPEIFLNSYQQKRAFTELQDFEEKIYFESLILSNPKQKMIGSFSVTDPEKKNEKQQQIVGELSSFTPVLNKKNESLNSLPIQTFGHSYAPEFFSESVQNRLHEKILELAIHYNEESIEAITNFFADLISFSSLCYLFFALEIQINITKSFLLEVFFGLDDSKKSLFILFLTDLLVGYHSPNIWELFFSSFFDHYGLPENQTTIFLLVATLPVLLDVLFKYLIFRHLNRASPATVATYHAMIE